LVLWWGLQDVSLFASEAAAEGINTQGVEVRV